MSYATVVNVTLEGGDAEEGQRMLREVLIPRLMSLTGFQSGRFYRSLDGATGMGSAVFDTEANAQAGLEAMVTNRPAGSPPVVSSAVYEVLVEV